MDLGEGRYRQATAQCESLVNGFTLLFEAILIALVRVMPVHQVCKMFGVTDHKVWSLVKKYTNLGREAADYSAVNTIGLDETAARLGHDYVTLFVDLAARRILLEIPDHVDPPFLSMLTPHSGHVDPTHQYGCDP